MLRRLTAWFQPTQPVPQEFRSNFSHFFLDIAWWGVLSGSAISFISIFITRQGALSWQIGLLSAVPAVVNLVITLPAGRWLHGRSMDRVVFWSALANRLFYMALIPLPWLLRPTDQVWATVWITLVMTVPGTVVAVAFNALFADAVPPQWRAYVVGTRNAILALVTTLTTLICGWILTSIPFPNGYPVVFGIGFLGSMMSTYHLYRIRSLAPGIQLPKPRRTIRTISLPGFRRDTRDATPSEAETPAILKVPKQPLIRFDILRGSFGRVILLLFLFHLAQFLAIPVFPLFQVNNLHFSDKVIGLGTAMFNATVFLGSTQVARMSTRWSNQQITGIGIVLLGIYPALMTVSQSLAVFALTSLLGGVAWSLAGGALYNYLVESVPDLDRPAHLAWYNLALNAAILIGSLGGAAIANQIGLPVALLVFAALRAFSGIAVLRWG